MLSRPVARALEDGLMTSDTNVLDYGCGRGGDLARLERLGIVCQGYDPVYRPAPVDDPHAVVNLGFVLNVIESLAERQRTLLRAWSLALEVLVVSARLADEAKGLDAVPHRDGFLTKKGTFQTFYTQASLRDFVEETLQRPAVAAAPGIFYVFRNPTAEQGFLARRVRRAVRRRAEIVFEQHQELLGALVAFVEERGRLPRHEERAAFSELAQELGSLRNAFLFVRRVTGEERWDRIRVKRSDDLLVYIALSRFRRRPPLGSLPTDLQYDIKDFFGSYKAACEQGDRLLFAVAESDRVRAAIEAAPVGKRTRDSLYVHVSALGELVPILRVLDGCARALLGTVDETTLVKFRIDRPTISYLEYPDFDGDPHPALRSAYVVDLESLRLDFRDYSGYANPPILHRKELFVAQDYPPRRKFERLTKQEARAGLYRDPERIGTRAGWRQVLSDRNVSLRGHRVVPAGLTPRS
jgi:DNA phosphorothioation-associated putative methyltransferase